MSISSKKPTALSASIQVGRGVLIGITGAGFLLDGLDLVGRASFANQIGNLACFSFPATVVARFYVPRNLVSYVELQCKGTISEPAISIAFFLLKLTLALLCVLYCTLDLAWHFHERKPTLAALVRKDGGFIGSAKRTGAIVVGFICINYYAFSKFATSASHFDLSFMGKLSEDFYALMVFTVAMMIVGYIASWLCYLSTDRRS